MSLVTQYKKERQSAGSEDSGLPDGLNEFYARFDREGASTPVPLPCDSHDPPFLVTEQEARRALTRLGVNGAAGPDGIGPRLLGTCSGRLASVFTFVFSWSLAASTVPLCFRRSAVVPVPGRPSPGALGDCGPVALASVMVKCFERFVLSCIDSLLPPDFDVFQFACGIGGSIGDAVAMDTHEVLTHLEGKKSCARILFVDCGLAFDAVVPGKLYTKLVQDLQFPISICNWVLDFLLDRPQVVRVGNVSSSAVVLDAGTPRGCPLSPRLCSIFTYDCGAGFPGCLLVEFAGDAAVAGLVDGIGESGFLRRIGSAVQWCGEGGLKLGVSGTGELVVGFRGGEVPPPPLVVAGDAVGRVDSFEFLGAVLSGTLGWELSGNSVCRGARRRVCFLRKLGSFGVNGVALIGFSRAVVGCVLARSIVVWFDGVAKEDIGGLNSVIIDAQRLIGVSLPSLGGLCGEGVSAGVGGMLGDDAHPAGRCFDFLPRGQGLGAFRGVGRLVDGFFPQAMRHFDGAGVGRLEKSETRVPLSGYGVELAIKSTEYKAKDDTKVEDRKSGDEDEEDFTSEDIEGINFKTLSELHPELKKELREFRNNLTNAATELTPFKVWQLQDLSYQAGQKVMSAPLEDSLQYLRDISQNFPTQARTLVKESVSSEFKREVQKNQAVSDTN
ncbi:UDP-glucose:glycoprotein glucosyltransferase 1 [Elysia marginata]|uniref:UDP-glucose:glycoprotein glucosyltransferase 1 n=1 Tax=Elysia marginata TaxID=1093978 RepID=A0AAV4ERJ8_9GAST|nr:UDP-glucose:glycoprotein glucosyltransferase 1 [Elysia marginata]